MLKNSILNVFSEKRKLAQGVTLAIAIFFCFYVYLHLFAAGFPPRPKCLFLLCSILCWRGDKPPSSVWQVGDAHGGSPAPGVVSSGAPPGGLVPWLCSATRGYT